MPIYEYVCQECDTRYEKFVRSRTAKIELKCPTCGSSHGEKAFSAFSTRGSSGTTGSLAATSSAPACSPFG
ncbi:MAG: zinc ribbon domain-containing protein [Anaerolineae bacterium]|nr:zinc ribbon domain-containing protein [Anaerolineae bacterium]